MKRARWSTRRRLALFVAHDGRCHICSGRIHVGEAWEISHQIPLELGGADDETNCAPAHKKCHRTLTAETDVPNIARAHRREAKHIGAHRTTHPIKGWRRFNGEPVRNPRTS